MRREPFELGGEGRGRGTLKLNKWWTLEQDARDLRSGAQV